MSTRLTTEQIERYSRQIMVPDIGGKGQIHLREARVLVIGAGGLGSPAAFYLAAAGVGTLGIIDPDKVELSNLQRQILHATPDIGKQKVESAKTKLNGLNPDVEVKTYPVRFDNDNGADIAAGYNFIVDGSDNFDTKFLVNDVAIRLGIAFSHAGIVRLQGQTMTVLPGQDGLLPLSLSRAASGRGNIELPASRHPRRGRRHTRHDPSNRSGEVPRRLRRRIADGSAADL